MAAEVALRAADIRAWLREHLTGEFAPLVGAGGPGREHEHLELRARWERVLGATGWIGIGWPATRGLIDPRPGRASMRRPGRGVGDRRVTSSPRPP